MLLGWREWVALPELGIRSMKAKIDTGARSSALHTFFLKTYREKGLLMIHFKVHPFAGPSSLGKKIVECHMPVIDRRVVTDSGGHRELRYVIQTVLRIAQLEWPIEMTLANREEMRYRMLLGRTALIEPIRVAPSLSYCQGRI